MKKLAVLLCISACFLFRAAFTQAQSTGQKQATPDMNKTLSFLNDALSRMDDAFSETEPSPEDGYFLGRAVAANILAVYKPYTANPELTRYLNLICQTIVINNPEIELYNGCHLSILDSKEINAFATPGGHIFITKTLVESATSEETLAAIIAHELAHIKLKHGMNMVNSMKLNSQMTEMAKKASDFAGGDSFAARRLMGFHDSVSEIMDTMLKNGYSQTQEFEADNEALSLLAASGYDPAAMLDVMNMLQSTDKSQIPGFSSTHPSPWERFQNIASSVGYYRVQDTRQYRVSRFRDMLH